VQESSLVEGTISEEAFIFVQPGDVLGFQVFSNDDDNSIADRGKGILLDTSFRDDIIWYRTIDVSNNIRLTTPRQLTVGRDGDLSNLERAGPVISPSVGEWLHGTSSEVELETIKGGHQVSVAFHVFPFQIASYLRVPDH
jgi:hypothetical protein